MPTIDVETLERTTRDIFAARQVPPADAALIARMLVRANLRGHDSHGVIRIPQYCAALAAGTLNPRPDITTVLETPVIVVLDGDRGFGQVVARRGMELAIAKAQAHGLAAVALRRTNHIGRLADWAEMAAAQGLIGMLWANAKGGLNVAPWGGAGRRLGTNPHAIAVPGPGGAVAMSHDFATSVWAEGKLRVKFNRGEAAPPGLGLARRGAWCKVSTRPRPPPRAKEPGPCRPSTPRRWSEPPATSSRRGRCRQPTPPSSPGCSCAPTCAATTRTA